MLYRNRKEHFVGIKIMLIVAGKSI